ncbi:MAG: PEGA domain-containing protein [Myxococcales bacterium]|nr:PEGA domain-containing protein [Myxococcales bacterium]
MIGPAKILARSLCLALVCAASAAAGQSAPGDAERAQRLLAEGIVAFEQGQNDVAIERFEASYRAGRAPVALVNLGQALRASGRVVEAIDAFERYLREGGARVPQERAAAVRETIETLRGQIASLVITSEPAGARVRVDGRDAGTTPLAGPVIVAAGVHTVELDLAEYVVVRERVRVGGRERRALSFRLATVQTAAELSVSIINREAPASRVLVDGIDLGLAPVSRRLSAGGHQLVIEASGYARLEQELVLVPRQRRQLRVELRRPSPSWLPWVLAGAGVAAIGATAATIVAVDRAQSRDIPNTPVIVVGPAPF